MPVQPMGNGGGSGFWGDGSFWIIILFLFAFMGNGWGGFGGGGNAGNEMQRGFDQQSVMSGIAGINSSLANAEVSRCNSQANILATLNNNSNNQMTAMSGYSERSMRRNNYAYMPDMYGNAYANRYPMNYNYDNSYGNGRGSWTATGDYSGHSIKDRMIDKLERMVDEAKSDYERQEIMNEIAKLKQSN